MQKFKKSVKIWQSYREFKVGNFLKQCSFISFKLSYLRPENLYLVLYGVFCYRTFVLRWGLSYIKLWILVIDASVGLWCSPSGCTFWGKKPWSRKKKILWQLGTLVGAPVGISLIAAIAVPAIIIGVPIWVGRKVSYSCPSLQFTYNMMQKTSKVLLIIVTFITRCLGLIWHIQCLLKVLAIHFC